MDFNQDVPDVRPLTPGVHEPWSRYPRSHFANWTKDQVKRCRMLSICQEKHMCKIHNVDVFENGMFDKREEEVRTRQIPSDPTSAREFWDDLHKPVGDFFWSRYIPA